MTRVRLADLYSALPAPANGWVELFARRAQKRGVALYLVGGPVRDFLLERPLRDVDLMVEAKDGEAIERIVRRAVRDDLRVVRHERFGTLTLRGDDFALDISTARREDYAHPGALPRVEAGSVEEDLLRRDFSVNAMAVPLALPDNEGAPLERVPLLCVEGSERDLRAGRLCILHPRSFHDDPTRALRAARFVPRLGFALSRRTRASLRDALRDGAFGAVSGDRLRREFEKVFEDASIGLDPSLAIRRLADWHVLSALEPGLDLPREVAAPLRRLGRALANPPWRLARHRAWVAGLCVWLAPMAPAMRRRVLARLTVRGEASQRISGFPRLRDGLLRQLERARGRGAVDAALSEIDEEALLALFASAPQTVRRRIARWAGEDRQRRPAVSGSDLVELGLEGPAVGRVLARVRSAYLDGGVANREEALALARELAQRARAIRDGKRAPRRSRTAKPARTPRPGGKGSGSSDKR